MAKKQKRKSSQQLDALIFIDTNIYLDFYRTQDKSFEVAMLKHIDQNHARIISTDQILMEYKKHRQKLILNSLKLIKSPAWENLVIPAFIADAQQSKMIQTKKKEFDELIKKLKKRVGEILKNPTSKDPIYQCLQRLLKDDVPYHLGRNNKLRYSLRHLARKRFCLGYPPRKDSDTSIGDAVNWEWIIHCAKNSNKDIIIVSRDSDYGIVFEDEKILNDWLEHEFKKRVSQRRKIILTEKLSTAFKWIGITITRKEEKQEEKVISLASEEDSIQEFLPAENFYSHSKLSSILENISKVQKQYEKLKKRK